MYANHSVAIRGDRLLGIVSVMLSGFAAAWRAAGSLSRRFKLTLTLWLQSGPTGLADAGQSTARSPRDLYQRYEFGLAGGGNSALSLGRTATVPMRPGLGRAAPRRAQRGLVTDLALDIGSGGWWRGLGICAALCLAAAWMAPDMRAIPVAPPAPMGDAQWQEARALAFAPLGLGADSGRRMAATRAVEPIEHAPERPTIDLLATLGRGDSFARVLERSGVGGGEAAQVAGMVGQVAALDAIRPGTPMDVRLGRRTDPHSARPLERLAFRARFDLDVVVAREAGVLRLKPIAIAVDDTPMRVQGRVGDSLYFAVRAAGAPPKAAEAYIRTLASQFSIGDGVGPDDRFDLIVSHRRALDGRAGSADAETGELLYAGLDRAAGKDLQLLPWTHDGQTQWFEASGVGRVSAGMSQPVAGPITSGFGPRRHPILGFVRMHKGIDFGAHYGQPIYATSTGRVIRAGWAGGYGNQVRIDHGNAISTSYSHMSRIVAAPGAMVRQGQVIGYVGSTGLSTGPHLHYELYRNGVPINPMSVRFVTRSLLEGAELEAFRARLAQMLGVKTGFPGRS